VTRDQPRSLPTPQPVQVLPHIERHTDIQTGGCDTYRPRSAVPREKPPVSSLLRSALTRAQGPGPDTNPRVAAADAHDERDAAGPVTP
jgi:hypothetical protein